MVEIPSRRSAVAIVVPACHFRDKDVLCQTTSDRLDAAFHLWEKYRDSNRILFVVTGAQVPYERGGKTLGTLMREHLIMLGVPEEDIADGNGFGTYDEADKITKMIFESGIGRFAVVSSSWYLWSGKPIWRHFAERQGLFVEFAPVRQTGGIRTKLTYAAYAVLIRFAARLGRLPKLGEKLTCSFQSRADGFTLDGCA